MFEYFVIFLVFSIISIIFRFIIGNPINSSRMQTKYKLKYIPNALNIILFFNTCKKPISMHVILFQIQNYFIFLFFILFSFRNLYYYKFYFNVECFAGFIIIILPLFLEKIADMIRGVKWNTADNKVELSFEDYRISFFSEKQSIFLSFGIYIGNELVFLDNEYMIVGEGTIDYKKKKIFISKINIPIPYLKNTDNIIYFCIAKQK